MFSDIFVAIAIFLYNSAPILAIICFALTGLNVIRKHLVARRRRAAQARHAAKKPAFNTFETL